MTITKLLKLYKHYKTDYDFRLKKITYAQLEEEAAHDGEFIPD